MKKLFLVIAYIILFWSCKNKNQNLGLSNALLDFQKENYKNIEVGNGQEMFYLDLGNTNAPTILLLHGEPNYSYVFRNIAPKLVDSGYRVIIPDLIGFGFSSKPTSEELITYANHTKWLATFINKLKLKNINLFAHDWGAMISLRIVAEQPYLFKKVAISYGYLFDGTEDIPDSFYGFRDYAKNDSTFLAGNIMDWGTNMPLPDSVKLNYNLPFKMESDFLSIRKFPSLIPTNNLDEEAILNQKLNKKLETFSKPFITIWGDHTDLMWIGKDSILQKKISGAKNRKHFVLESNHFIQEDQPEKLSLVLLDFFRDK